MPISKPSVLFKNVELLKMVSMFIVAINVKIDVLFISVVAAEAAPTAKTKKLKIGCTDDHTIPVEEQQLMLPRRGFPGGRGGKMIAAAYRGLEPRNGVGGGGAHRQRDTRCV